MNKEMVFQDRQVPFENLIDFQPQLKIRLPQLKLGDNREVAIAAEQFKVLFHLAIVAQLELRQSNLELRLKINEILKGYLTILEDIITEGKEAGEFKSTLDVRLAKQILTP